MSEWQAPEGAAIAVGVVLVMVLVVAAGVWGLLEISELLTETPSLTTKDKPCVNSLVEPGIIDTAGLTRQN